MSYSPYTLDIVSQHNQFNNKTLRKFNVEGIETVGAWGNEPFEIVFKNNTYQKVQVKISIDGTDIMTGDLASTAVTDKMWLVEANSTLTLKAWPEDNNGGARFVFTSGNKGVAANTHGDVSNLGIIAAAVYIEGDLTPFYLNGNYWNNVYGRRARIGYNSQTKGILRSEQTYSTNSLDLMDVYTNCDESFGSTETSTGLVSQASVGAGEFVTQNIKYVEGLRKPVFTEAVRVRYVWWDELKAKLQENYKQDSQPSGFPADKKNIDLGNTPRIKTSAASFRRSENPEFSRF